MVALRITSRWVTIDGAELYVEVIGAGESKPYLIAPHGDDGIDSFLEPKQTFGPGCGPTSNQKNPATKYEMNPRSRIPYKES